MLEQYCSHSKQRNKNVVTPRCAKNCRCESSRVISPLVENKEVGVQEVREAGGIEANYAIELNILQYKLG